MVHDVRTEKGINKLFLGGGDGGKLTTFLFFVYCSFIVAT